MIKYLNNKEKNKTRTIWEKVFEEDSKSFLDYYYNYKNIDNKILCKMINNKIVSMLHLNPYKISIRNNIYKSYYIVAVATLKEYRKKGYMSELLKESIKKMYEEKIPFTFLRPAKKEIYLPFGFEYIYNHNFLELKNSIAIEETPISENDYNQLASFTNKFLLKRFNTFILRDENYIKTLHEEVKSENGNIIKLYNNKVFIGYYVYWGIAEKITRAIFIDDNFTEIKKNKELVMARILNLYEFCSNFSSNTEENISIYLDINDNIIEENNNKFKLSISKNTSKIEKVSSFNENPFLQINIQNLLSLMFGYKSINYFTKNENIINCFKKINLLDKVFIDEEV